MRSDEINKEELYQLSDSFEGSELVTILRRCWDRYGTRAAIGTSFQGAGLVVLHTAMTHGFHFPVFTIDTGLLFPETLELKQRLEARYGITIESLQPEQSLGEQAREFGDALWSRSPDLCCTMRKVIPLQKKLSALAVWITGMRRQQSDTRSGIKIIEIYKFDVLRDQHIIKLNPMAGWRRDQVEAFLKEQQMPTNALLDRGYRSIGCSPCTRPVGAGENERAGRWTGFDKAECGIHTFLGSNI